MSSRSTPPQTNEVFPQLQIVAGAMIMALVMMAAVAAAIRWETEPGNAVIGYAAAALALANVVAFKFVSSSVVHSQIQQLARRDGTEALQEEPLPAARLYPVFRARTIIEFAVLEGAALVLVIAYLVSAHRWLLAVAVVLLFVMATIFPTRSKAESWVQEQWQIMQFR